MEDLADPKQCNHCNGSIHFDLLPMSGGEAKRNHVLLAEPRAFRSLRTILTLKNRQIRPMRTSILKMVRSTSSRLRDIVWKVRGFACTRIVFRQV